jgi:hypothetical protein
MEDERPPSGSSPRLLAHQTRDRCGLLWAASGESEPCRGEACMYWRVLEAVGVEKPDETGCAVRYFALLRDGRPEVADWLLSVKRRVEALDEDGACK